MVQYVPSLPSEAFWPLPDGLALPGSPVQYRFPMFWLPEFGSEARGEVAGRIMIALGEHRAWKAIDMSFLGDSLIRELEARLSGQYEHCVLYSMTSSPDEALETLYGTVIEMVEEGLLGYLAMSPEDQLVWPTEAFVELMASYRVEVS